MDALAGSYPFPGLARRARLTALQTSSPRSEHSRVKDHGWEPDYVVFTSPFLSASQSASRCSRTEGLSRLLHRAPSARRTGITTELLDRCRSTVGDRTFSPQFSTDGTNLDADLLLCENKIPSPIMPATHANTNGSITGRSIHEQRRRNLVPFHSISRGARTRKPQQFQFFKQRSAGRG